MTIKLDRIQHYNLCQEEFYIDNNDVEHSFELIRVDHEASGRHQEYWSKILQRKSDDKFFITGYSDSVKDSMGWEECNWDTTYDLEEYFPSGVELIELERKRHFKLGYNDEHDAHEVNQELAVAAGLYALSGTYAMEILEASTTESGLAELWPWRDGSYPDTRGRLERIRELTIAGALIAAEIDRLQNESRKLSRIDKG